VALQLWGTLFSVPQISARLEEITEEQKAVLARYLSFWNAHRKTITKGTLRVKFTESSYGYAEASHEDEAVAILTSNSILEPNPDFAKFYAINLTDSESMILKNPSRVPLSCTVYDCKGNVIDTTLISEPLAEVNIPLGGMTEIIKATT